MAVKCPPRKPRAALPAVVGAAGTGAGRAWGREGLSGARVPVCEGSGRASLAHERPFLLPLLILSP